MLRRIEWQWSKLKRLACASGGATRRGPLLVLLLTWAIGLCAPALHDEVGEIGQDSHDAPAARAGHSRHECSGVFARHDRPVVHEGCDAGDDCRIPTHHHHGNLGHDPTHCPACSSSLERASELPSFRFTSAPLRLAEVQRIARVLTPAERHVCALARGPPSATNDVIVGALGS